MEEGIIQVGIRIYIYANINATCKIYMYVCIHVHKVCVYIYMCVCVSVCEYIYVYTRVYTYIYIYIRVYRRTCVCVHRKDIAGVSSNHSSYGDFGWVSVESLQFCSAQVPARHVSTTTVWHVCFRSTAIICLKD